MSMVIMFDKQICQCSIESQQPNVWHTYLLTLMSWKYIILDHDVRNPVAVTTPIQSYQHPIKLLTSSYEDIQIIDW